MKKRILYMLVAIVAMLPLSNALAQTTGTHQKLVTQATGQVIDDKGEAVPYATVRIKQVNGNDKNSFNQITDNEGVFKIGLPTHDKYEVQITYVGMKTLTKQFTIPTNKPVHQLGKLTLEHESTQLKGVTVSKARTLIKMDVDKIAYSMNEDPESKTSNLLNMLRKVPMVTVDGEENVQVNGSSKFQIYLNGKPSTMMSSSPKEVLRSLPASSIKNVEVITNPGVKFDAEGGGAILNIVTDQGQGLAGIAGSVNTATDTNGSLRGGLFLNAKKGKWGLTGNYNAGFHRMPKTFMETETVTNTIRSMSNMENKLRNNFQFFNATLTYELDSLNLFSLSTNGMLFDSNADRMGFDARFDKQNVLLSKTSQQGNSTSDGGNFSFNVDYQHSTQTPGELLTISYMYDRSPNNSNNTLIRKALDPKTEQELQNGYAEQITTNEASMREHTGQIDYTRPLFGENKYKLESGAKFIARRSSSSPLYQARFSPNAPFADGSIYGQNNGVNELEYSQNIFAGYTAVSARWTPKFSTQVGLRIEGGNWTVNYPKNPNAGFKRTMLDWVPQVRLGYNFSMTDQMTLNYDFKIRRPGIQQMNPYRLQENDYSVSFGNPDLEAQKNHHINLGFNHFSPKFVFNSSLNYTFSNNVIESYIFNDPKKPNLIQTTFGNIGQNKELGLSASVNYTPKPWLRLIMQGNASYNYVKSTALNLTDEWTKAMSFFGAHITLPKDWSIFAHGGIFSQGGFQQKRSTNFFSMINISKAFWQKKLNVSLGIVEPFRKEVIYRGGSFGNGFETTTAFINPNARYIRLSINYSFGELKQKIKRVKGGIVNDDLIKGNNQGQEADQGAGGMTN